MTIGRHKSTAYVRLIRPARACPLPRLAKWESRRFPAATAQPQLIRFRTIALVLFERGHATDVPLPGKRFSASYHF